MTPKSEADVGFYALKAWLDVHKDEEFDISDEEIIDFLNAGVFTELTFSEDYSNYDSQRCRNGGSYGFWKTLEKTAPGLYRIVHHTTADFEYCGACGSFTGHDEEECGFEEVDLRSETQKKETIIEAIREHRARIVELKHLLEKIRGEESG